MANIKYIIYLLGKRFFTILPKRLQRVTLQVCRTIVDIAEFTEVAEQTESIGFEGRWISSDETTPENEMNLVKLAITAYIKAKEKQLDVPIVYQPGGKWGNDRLRIRFSSYDDAISQGDLATMAGLLRNFFRNEAISGLWNSEDVFDHFYHLNKIDQVARISIMLKHYRTWRETLPLTPIKELDAPRVGNPWGYNLNGILLYEPVFEYNFQAHYFAHLLASLNNPVVLEIGGGFGGLASNLLRFCPGIKYIGLDLPENILIQTYYLASIFPNLRILTYLNDSSKLDLTQLDQFDVVLLPNFELPRIDSGIIDLIINVRSLSEMTYNTISEYYRQIDRIGRLYYFQENICKVRLDEICHLPTNEFPNLNNFTLVASSESRWARWNKNDGLPCQENLYIHNHILSSTPNQILPFVQISTPIQVRQPSSTTQPTCLEPRHPVPPNGNIVINHANWDWYNSQPQKVIDGVSTTKVFLAHASIGANIMQCIADLHCADPLKYPLSQLSSGAIPPATTVKGTIYKCNRGNPGGYVKISSFNNYVNNGWYYPKVNVAINKLCAIDENADWLAYRDSLSSLEILYPSTLFVYMTMPYDIHGGKKQILRNQFNQSMRNWIATQSNRILFDIADIEAWSPGGNHVTFIYNSLTCEKLYIGYSVDGIHLNSEGRYRAAIGLYSLFGQIIPQTNF